MKMPRMSEEEQRNKKIVRSFFEESGIGVMSLRLIALSLLMQSVMIRNLVLVENPFVCSGVSGKQDFRTSTSRYRKSSPKETPWLPSGV